MASMITLFPVGNGDMTLIQTESRRSIMIDLNIRDAADNRYDHTPDVIRMLRKRLQRDHFGRMYVDVFLLSHPDKDHCTGLQEHFHLGPPENWSRLTDKIIIREMWSSPMVFRRMPRDIALYEDAVAFNEEARRRARKFRDFGGIVLDGDRILILGEDKHSMPEYLDAIHVPVDDTITKICGHPDWSMTARVLAPLPELDDDQEAEFTKNESSTILRFSLSGGQFPDMCRFLTGGDAEVAIWEELWRRHYMREDWLSYDILLAPHHCSWHSLSNDSLSKMGIFAKASEDARYALSRARPGATIVVSSKPIKNDNSDPPCFRAMLEYKAIANDANGKFVCVGENPSEEFPDVTEFGIGIHGPRLMTRLMNPRTVFGSGAIGGQPLSHG